MKSSNPPSRSIALAYAITGLAVASALVALVGVSAGLFGTRSESVLAEAPAGLPTLTASPAPAPTPALASGEVAANPAAVSGLAAFQAPAPEPPAEIVYVDAPPAGRERGHECEDHEGRERHEHDDRDHEGDDD